MSAAASSDDSGFLVAPPPSEAVQALYDGDLHGSGYVMNLTRLWAHQPASLDGFSALMGAVLEPAGITHRERVILVAAVASSLGDAYCSLAYGQQLAGEVGDDLAAAVLRGDYTGLGVSEMALAQWARLVATDPNATTADDVDALRSAGFDDGRIFAITAYLALRIAFSTVNDALGARPDRRLAETAPAPVVQALDFGRPIGD